MKRSVNFSKMSKLYFDILKRGVSVELDVAEMYQYISVGETINESPIGLWGLKDKKGNIREKVIFIK